jgi:hypothetical protein
MLYKHSSLATAVFLFFILASSAQADRVLDQGLRRMAEKIKKFLEAEGLPKSMIVGDFSGTPRLRASGGVGIEVADDGLLQLMGSFKTETKQQQRDDEHESLALHIDAKILDDNDNELAIIPVDVFASVALQLAGIDIDIPADVKESVREQETVKQSKDPRTTVERSVVRPTASSTFGIGVLVDNANRLEARTATLDRRKRAFVELHKSEEYVVRLVNNADIEVAAELTVDGVSAFALANDKRLKGSLFIIKPKSSVLVPGWFRDQSNTNKFKIGGYAESVNKKVGGSSASVGMITAKFRASWGGSIPRPADEAGGNSKDATPASKATVLGPEIKKNYERVQREFGRVRAVVNIRYDK